MSTQNHFHPPTQIYPLSSRLLELFALRLFWTFCLHHIHFIINENKRFLPPKSAWVRRAKTTEQIFIFHNCSLHKLSVKWPWITEAPGFPPPTSVIWNMGRPGSTQDLPQPLLYFCQTMKHSWVWELRQTWQVMIVGMHTEISVEVREWERRNWLSK